MIQIIHADVIDGLKQLPDESVQCVVTSPPYWGLRDYGVDGQIGLEKTPDEYVSKMVEVFREVKRVLRKDGTLWLNLGACYASNGVYIEKYKENHPEHTDLHTKNSERYQNKKGYRDSTFKAKDLIGIPWLVALALQADGWYLRSDIIWNKPNPMPSSVEDRPTTSHEYIFLLTKSAKYFYDGEAIREDAAQSCGWDRSRDKGKYYSPGLGSIGNSHEGLKSYKRPNKQDLTGNPTYTGFNERWKGKHSDQDPQSAGRRLHLNTQKAREATDLHDGFFGITRNRRTVWTITTQARPEAHFACVDDETEALTVNGWRNVHCLKDTEDIVAFDGKELMWSKATIHKFPFSGKMVVIESRDLSMWLTPNHRVVCRDYKRKGEWKIKQADQLLGREEIPTVAPFFNSSNVNLQDEALAELAGWVLTDGSYNKGNTVSLYQTGGRGKHEKIEDLFKELGITPHLYQRDRGHGDERSYSFSGPVVETIKKEFPHKEGQFHILFTWSERDLKALWRGMTEGDGNQRTDGRITFVGNRSKVDFYQALCLRLGLTCRITPRDGTGNSFSAFVSKKQSVSMRGTNGQASTIQKDCYYDGVVWCPNVKTGMWLARRNGRPFITGNTFPDEIPRVCISAGTSEYGCCPSCGAPWKRIVEVTGGTIGKSWSSHDNELFTGHKVTDKCGKSVSIGQLGENQYKREQKGWQPTCKCDPVEKPVHCVVLDPFGGSGTTAKVARELNRDAILIELSAEYIKIMRKVLRLNEQLPGVEA
ncbi:MAG: site-specific DNA-methyltransferase [Methanoregula sp.]|jgi:DNA modification methylase|nr:site-specific DNA-methyltransferase [Methanoregula sp.]